MVLRGFSKITQNQEVRLLRYLKELFIVPRSREEGERGILSSQGKLLPALVGREIQGLALLTGEQQGFPGML